MKVSIIIPVYNVESYLHKCMDSILTQTHRDFELILIDDGSKDLSGNICDDYSKKDDRVKVIHVPNGGVSAARNRGIDEATTDWIFFIDSDDWIDDIYLETLISGISSDTAIAYCGVVNEYTKDNTKTIAFGYSNAFCSKQDCKADFIAQHRLLQNGLPYAKMYNKKVLDKYGIRFDTSISFHEDHLFVFQYLMHVSEITTIDKTLYHYRHEGTQQSLSSKKHDPLKILEAGEKMLLQTKVLIDRYQIKDADYLCRAYTDVALCHIAIALLQSDEENKDEILQTAYRYKRYFEQYYKPNNKIARFLILAIMKSPGKYGRSLLLRISKKLYNKKYKQ